MSKEEQYVCLNCFYPSVRKKDGMYCKSSSTRAMKATIDRFLYSPLQMLCFRGQEMVKGRSSILQSTKSGFAAQLLVTTTLDNMLKEMPKRAGILPHFTNHCLSATSVTVFPNHNGNMRHIKSITGPDQTVESYNEWP